jgi:hypothetical protein
LLPAKVIADSADGGVIEECGHWVFEEKIDFVREQLSSFVEPVVHNLDPEVAAVTLQR